LDVVSSASHGGDRDEGHDDAGGDGDPASDPPSRKHEDSFRPTDTTPVSGLVGRQAPDSVTDRSLFAEDPGSKRLTPGTSAAETAGGRSSDVHARAQRRMSS
jgi:hypothetical protein